VNDQELLALHRELVATPSVSRAEGPICALLEERLAACGLAPRRHGRNLWALAGEGPILCLNSHLDTVPPSGAWTRDPFAASREDGRVFGLGANDAKASVAAMIAAFARLRARAAALGIALLLTLACDEETGGEGTEVLLPELARRGLCPRAALIGEPTGLELAIAQKGMLVLELARDAKACHAAHARALGVENPIRALARDLVALDAVDLGPVDPWLGEATIEPTVLAGGAVRNMVPERASCVLDVRTNPAPGHATIVERLRAAAGPGLRVVSQRLGPCATGTESAIVRAAQRARPEARLFGSRGVSDWVYFGAVPAVKVGPGLSERSHTADEFVLEREIVDGARFYEAAAVAFAELAREEGAHASTLGAR
jgi:acetylornithine deacetylase